MVLAIIGMLIVTHALNKFRPDTGSITHYVPTPTGHLTGPAVYTQLPS